MSLPYIYVNVAMGSRVDISNKVVIGITILVLIRKRSNFSHFSK